MLRAVVLAPTVSVFTNGDIQMDPHLPVPTRMRRSGDLWEKPKPETGILVQCAVETRESKLASPALMSGIGKQLDEGRIDQALSQAKSDSGYAGRVLAAALSRKSVGGDVRRGFEDAAAFHPDPAFAPFELHAHAFRLLRAVRDDHREPFGIPAGERQADGSYPPTTFNKLVSDRLSVFNQIVLAAAKNAPKPNENEQKENKTEGEGTNATA